MDKGLPKPLLAQHDGLAKGVIGFVSVVVFAVVVVLSRYQLSINVGFDVHYFALFNAVINSIVAFLLVCGWVAVRRKKWVAHKKIMQAAIYLSIAFLVSYIAHHLLGGDTRFGDANKDGLLSEGEKLAVGNIRYVYYVLLSTHIVVAAIILPLVLFAAYTALTGQYEQHKKWVRYGFPLWMFVAITGPIVYLMIKKYY